MRIFAVSDGGLVVAVRKPISPGHEWPMIPTRPLDHGSLGRINSVLGNLRGEKAAGTRRRNGENPPAYCDHRRRQNMMPALWGVSLARAQPGRLHHERLWRDL